MADDLTTIKGIGPGRARTLADELGVQTFADLAALDPDVIVAALRRRRQALGRETAALWVAEAERRAHVDPQGWQTAALFLVYYETFGAQRRTAARHVDAGTDAEWPGHVTTEVVAWIGDQFAGSGPDTPAEAGQPPRDVPMADAEDAPTDPSTTDDAEPEAHSGPGTAPLVSEVLLFAPPDAEAPQTVGDDGNLHHVVPAHAPFSIALSGTEGGSDAGLGVRTRRVGEGRGGARDWPAAAGAAAGTARVVVPGLAPGLYRLVVTRAGTPQEQVGPLLLVD